MWMITARRHPPHATGQCICQQYQDPQWDYRAGGEEHVKLRRNHGGTDSEGIGRERTGS